MIGESSRAFASKAHDLRATLECGPLRLPRESGSSLTVRRPKPLIPLTTAPHRVNANSKNSCPAATVARRLPIRASANKGAMIAIAANDADSFVVSAFMRFCFASRLCSRCGIASLTNLVFTTPMPCALKAMNIGVRLILGLVDEPVCRHGFTKRMVTLEREAAQVGQLRLLLVYCCVAHG